MRPIKTEHDISARSVPPASVLQVVTAGRPAGLDSRRVWVCPGQAVIVRRGLSFRAFVDGRAGGVGCVIDGPDLFHADRLQPGDYLDASGWCGLLAVPRAIERDATGRAWRLLFEFIRVRAEVTWAA